MILQSHILPIKLKIPIYLIYLAFPQAAQVKQETLLLRL